MLEVQIENIIPVTEARDKFNQMVDAVEGTEELYVLTKNGKPAAIVVGIHHLEKLTGETHSAVFGSETESTSSAAPAQQAQEPVVVPPVETPAATPITNSAPSVADFSSTPQPAPEQTPASTTPTKLSDAITFDNMPPQTPVASVPVSIPADNDSTTTPIDSPFIDPSTSAAGGQAIAPDAVTPDQAGPSADPFAIPSEPLDLPEDNQVQAPPAAPTQGQTQ